MALVPTDEELGAETTCRCGCRIMRCRGVRTSWMHADTRSEECWDKGPRSTARPQRVDHIVSGTPLRLRLPQAMKDELTAAATKAGVTPSDFIRSAIQRELDRRRHPSVMSVHPVGRTVVHVGPSPPPVAHVVVVERRGGQLRVVSS